MRDLEHLKTNLNHQWPPIGAPMNLRREEPWKSQFDDSVNAVSFGFVATAILISMFLVMAIFERLIRTTTTSTTNSDSSSSRVLPGMDSRVGFNGAATKLGYQSPKMTVYSNGVSVLMPGDDIPTFIAHPAPVPCPPQNISQSQHQHGSSKDSSSSNSIQEC
ncbi:CTTNBP 2 amino-terminal-like protein [Arabidopsis thaliana]|uniref:CTTNBP 2 amino-terminal-like protein n=1 Tax=Arabidopsis thaliana TaxID=3702 RepID=F4I7D7_ARATH|nr:CTTNBP 2 amino-terminal-like protein [Arabidopsis thaliana]AEE28688.1 CTTNBP 2 amino-terminal-like protein [Arabidopsis thaliana]|eukprot:NP_001154324.1 CTTNBP 2 amino-terminal-like protein [Arabidopsis thaliana]